MPPENHNYNRHSRTPSPPTATSDEHVDNIEQATLEALTTTLRNCNAHLGGSAIGKGFRLAARYHLHKRAPNNIPLIGSSNQLSSLSLLDSSTSSSSKEIKSSTTTVNTPTSRHIQWDDSALEPGVQHTIEDPFYIVDLGIVSTQLARWRAAFPRVIPYYAVKCNPDPAIVRTLMSLGCNFDCASRAEIQLVQDATQDLPRKPDIIYANPCKARAHLIEAVCKGVKMVTFDMMDDDTKLES